MAWINTTAAAREAQVSPSTIWHWLNRHPNLGRKIAGRWRIDPDCLSRIIDGTETPLDSSR